MEDMTIIKAVQAALVASIGYIIGWLFTRKKTQVETEGTELQNILSTMKIYRDMIDDLKLQIKCCNDNIDYYKKQGEANTSEIKRLKTVLFNIASDVCTRSNCADRIPLGQDELLKIIEDKTSSTIV